MRSYERVIDVCVFTAGLLHGDVTYSHYYDFMNCLESSPCFGWMNSNAYWRNATTARAEELNQVYSQVRV
jgi:acyloxyacyl hydrolase